MPSQSFFRFMAAFRDVMPEVRAQSETLEGVRTAIAFFNGRYRLDPDISVTPVDAGGVPAEWVCCDASREDRVMLYIHGGCYISGSPETVRECCARLARACGVRVLSIDYRLAPEHPYPAAVDDCLAAYAWLIGEGVDPGKLVVAGESAGGGLTLATLMRLHDEGTLPLPAAGVPISPWIDLTLSHATLTTNAARDIASVAPLAMGARLYVGEDGDPRAPYTSPLFGSLSGLPPLLIQVGGGEVLLDDAIAIAHAARRQGVEVTFEVWPAMVHIWHWYAARLEEGAAAIAAIGDYVRGRIG